MIVSLSPFHVPRRSGIAVCAAAAAPVVSAASVTMQASLQANFAMAVPALCARFDLRGRLCRVETRANQAARIFSPWPTALIFIRVAVRSAGAVHQPPVDGTFSAQRETPGYACVISGHGAWRAKSDRRIDVLVIPDGGPAAWIWRHERAADNAAILILDAGMSRRRRRTAKCRCGQRDCDNGKVTHHVLPSVQHACLK
jgi:hypothetical protein